jgi:hypothetical protein
MEDHERKGSLRLLLGNAESRSIGPSIAVEPARYSITCSGPGESSFQMDTGQGEITIDELLLESG